MTAVAEVERRLVQHAMAVLVLLVRNAAVQVKCIIMATPTSVADAGAKVIMSVQHVAAMATYSVHAASDVAPSIRMTDNCLTPSSLKGKGAYSTLIKILKHVKV